MKKADLLSIFFLLSDFICCVMGIWSSRTLDPYARERNKVLKDLDHIKTSREALLVSWLVNERVERTQKEEEIGVLKKTLDDTKNIALKLFVIPYFCQKFELYGEHWDTNPKEVVEDFNPDDLSGTSIIKHHLEDEQTRELYTANAKKWNRILSKSAHPLAIKFKKSLQEKYPDVSLSILAKNLGLAIALLNNAKHGVVVANLPEALELLQTDSAIEALSKWGGLSDPVILDVIYEFEKTTSNRQWKPT